MILRNITLSNISDTSIIGFHLLFFHKDGYTRKSLWAEKLNHIDSDSNDSTNLLFEAETVKRNLNFVCKQ